MMQLRSVFTFILFSGVIIPSISFAKLVAEKNIDDKWVVGYITENSVHATVNGQVTHGDGLHVRMVKGHCDRGNILTFVYTYSKHPKIEQLKGRILTTKFMGNEETAKVVHASPFLNGHRATIDLGWARVDGLKDILSKKNPIVIEYLDTKKIKITDYFDITHNSWSNDGLGGTLDRAVEMCKKL